MILLVSILMLLWTLQSFFLDAMENVVDGIAAIQHVLRPGGRWFNVGPLHYHPHSTVKSRCACNPAATFLLIHVRVARPIRHGVTHGWDATGNPGLDGFEVGDRGCRL